MTKLTHISACLAFLLAVIPLPGQVAEEPTEDPGLTFTAESNLVIVPLYVYKGRRSVGGLGKEAFELLENGAPQDIAVVEGPGSGRTIPVEITLLLDVSHSVMRRGFLNIGAIQNSFLKGGLREDVSIAVYGFAGKLTRFTAPTRNMARIEHALKLAYEFEDRQTRLYEAMIQALGDMTSPEKTASRMLVVFSDGLSTTAFGPAKVARAAKSLGVPIYPVVLGHRRGQDKEFRQAEFAELGPKTGGRSFDLKASTSAVVQSILGSLASLAQSEYIVGYYPRSLEGEPTERTIRVRLLAKNVGKIFGGRRTILH